MDVDVRETKRSLFYAAMVKHFAKVSVAGDVLPDSSGHTMWLIDRVSPQDETVFLTKAETGTQRQFSVPGAFVATIENGKLLIQTSTG